MPRIRKKTSNRQATRDRAKITKKVAEHKKKSKRDAKKKVTWKSKKKADIGVPSSFHLKDEVLAQMAAEKRLALEEKVRRKMKVVEEEEDEEDTPGIQSLVGSTVRDRAPLTGTASMVIPQAESDDDDDIPDLLDSDLPTLQAAMDAADILLEVVDARDIAGSRSATVESLMSEAGGKVFIVVNKVDLVPREALQAWIAHLPFPAFLFSARESLGRDELLSALAAAVKAKAKGEPLKAALLGLPNVGKSSVANALLGKDLLKTAPETVTVAAAKNPAPTTDLCREIQVQLPSGGSVQIIDTPGWEYVEEEQDEEEDDDEEDEGEDEDNEMDEDEDDDDDDNDDDEDEDQEDKWDALEARVAGDLLRRNLGRVDRVKDVFPLVNYIVSRSNAHDLMLKYNVPYFEAGDVEAFLTGLARVNQRVKKFGEPNHDAAARIVLADWALNRFPYYTTVPKGTDIAMETDDVERPDMSAVLAQCKTRKELKAAGLIRFVSGEVDTRDVFLDDDYTAMSEPEDEDVGSDEEDDEELEFDEDEMDELDSDAEPVILGSDEGEELELGDGPEPSSGSDLEEEDESESETTPEPQPVRAGKRKAAAPPSPEIRKKAKVSKSVSFKAKLEAPKSVAREIKELPKSILKTVPAPAAAAAPAPIKEPKEPKKKEAKVTKAAAPAKPKTRTMVNTPIPDRSKAATAEAKPKKTADERKALREAKRAAKAAAPPKPAPATPAPVPEPKKGKAAKKDKAAKGKANGAPSAYDFSKHF